MTKFKTAREIFIERGAKKDADKLYEYELLAKNAFELILVLSPFDEKYLSSLKNSQSLTELKEKISGLSKSMEGLIEGFGKEKLSEDVIHLLENKVICFAALSDALDVSDVDIAQLTYAKDLFEEWGFYTAAMAVSTLVVFIHRINRYNSLADFPKTIEEYLLELLGTTHVLDGKLTEEISGEIRGVFFTERITTPEITAPETTNLENQEGKTSKKGKRKNRSRTRKKR